MCRRGYRQELGQAFDDAETLEDKHSGDRGRATYARLARSANPRIRAGALVRLARLARSTEPDLALRTYRELAGITTVAFGGMPAVPSGDTRAP